MTGDAGAQLGLTQQFAEVAGRRISYLCRRGDPTLVLIPGSHQDFRQYDKMLPRLDAGLGVVIVELPGHRASRQIPANPCIERFALDVVAVMTACNPGRWIVAGHSLGGMVAIEVAWLNPPGLAGVISIEGWTHCSVAEVLGGPLMYHTLTPEQRAEQDRRRQQATGHRTADERALLSGLWTRWTGMKTLLRTDLPVLELWGDRGLDPRPDQAALQIPDRPNIILHWLKDASHNLPLERPIEVVDAIHHWLARIRLLARTPAADASRS